MLRLFMFLAAGGALFSAFALYTVSYQTRQVAEANGKLQNDIQTINRDIAILRAERSYLMRPERIEPLARKLGMRPLRGEQVVSGDELQARLLRR